MRGAQFKAHGKRGGVSNIETTKAAAWAVFEHHGGGAGIQSTHGMAVRRATRFKVNSPITSFMNISIIDMGLQSCHRFEQLLSSRRTLSHSCLRSRG